jgi:rhamnulokinase
MRIMSALLTVAIVSVVAACAVELRAISAAPKKMPFETTWKSSFSRKTKQKLHKQKPKATKNNINKCLDLCFCFDIVAARVGFNGLGETIINCLVFDLGAGSGRAMLARLEGETLALSEVHRFSGIETSREGGPHWDLDRLLKEVDRGIEIASSLVTRIDAIGVDSWGVDYALLDASGRLEPWPFHYRHPRSQHGFDAFPASPETMFERTGSQSLPVNTVYQLYSASRTDRQALDKSRHALMIADAVNYHLTGIARSNATLARTTGLLSLDGGWDTTIINEAGLPQTLLAPLIEPGAIVGPLHADIRSKSRATEETLVISVAAHDTASAICGLPVEGDDAFLICGSWSILGRECAKPVVSHEAMLDGFGNEGGPDGHILYLKSLNGCCRSCAPHGRSGPAGQWTSSRCRKPPRRRRRAAAPR